MDIQKILVPLDGSDRAERVVGPAVRLAEAVGAEVWLLTVLQAGGVRAEAELVSRVVQSNQVEAELYLSSARKRALPTTVTIETAVATGSAAAEILHFAGQRQIDLIVMSTHGRSGLTRWSYGRVAEKVLRRAPCPIVILRSHQEIVPENVKRILTPLDGSALAEQVLAATQTIATGTQAEIILLRVVEPALLDLEPVDEADYAAQVEESRAYLTAVQEKFTDHPWPIRTAVLVGRPAETIIDFADAEGVDLIVLSSLGSSGFQMWLFGSVAERVMQAANCATLVVRQEKG